jgi:hypothetical protein
MTLYALDRLSSLNGKADAECVAMYSFAPAPGPVTVF